MNMWREKYSKLRVHLMGQHFVKRNITNLSSFFFLIPQICVSEYKSV
jgi:hypothetical protein